MFGMGMGELIVILVVALLVLGPDKLPEAARAIGKGMRELRKQTRVVQETIEQDETLGSTVRDLQSMLRGEDPRPVIKPPQHSPVGRTPLAAPAAAAQVTAAGPVVDNAPVAPESIAPLASPADPVGPAAPTVVVADGDKSGSGSGTV